MLYVTPAQKSGFTLVEMAIVLVIIGLVAGGVLVGKELIDNAQLSSVIRDIQKFQTAANTFRTKYDCLPGDCKKATTYFGALDPTPATCYDTDTPAGSTLTCDGDGDGHIGTRAENCNNTTHAQLAERYRFWQQLRSAGYIEGNYTGRARFPDDFNNNRVGEIVPATRWKKNVGFIFYYMEGQITAAGSEKMYYGTDMATHIMQLRNTEDHSGLYDYSSDAARFWDLKVDDGVAFSGMVRVMNNSGVGATPWNPCGIVGATAVACAAGAGSCMTGGDYPAVPVETCSAYFITKF